MHADRFRHLAVIRIAAPHSSLVRGEAIWGIRRAPSSCALGFVVLVAVRLGNGIVARAYPTQGLLLDWQTRSVFLSVRPRAVHI